MPVVMAAPDARPTVHRTTPRCVPPLPAQIQDGFADLVLQIPGVLPDAIQQALQEAAETGLPVQDVLVSRGVIDEPTAYRLLADAAGVPFEDSAVMPGLLAVRLVPEPVARRHEIVPVGVDDYTITYLTATPFDLDAEQDVRTATGRVGVPRLTCRSWILRLLDQAYPLQVDVAAVLPSVRGRSRSVVEWIGPRSCRTPADAAALMVCGAMLARAVDAGATLVQLDPTEAGVSLRTGGHDGSSSVVVLPAPVADAVRRRLKALANLDPLVRYRAQDGGFAVRIQGRRIDVQVTAVPARGGEQLLLRVSDTERGRLSLEELGYHGDVLMRLYRVLERRDGLLLVTGPARSGKTTTLHAALQYLRGAQRSIVAIEDPIERTVAGVTQVPVNPRVGATLSSVLRSVLRQEPDVLMVSDIRDHDVAALIGQALTGDCLVLSSLCTADAASAVTRLLALGFEPFRVADTLSGILAQRLVRELCPRCRERGPDGWIAGRGCTSCSRTGYVGALPVVELLTPNDEIRRVIARGGSAAEIREAMQDVGMALMRECATELVLTGLTSNEEVLRAFGADHDGPLGSAALGAAPSILVAQDEPITRTLVKLLLEREGYAVIEAQAARQAVELAAQHLPDLVVMDLSLPDQDGCEAVSLLRRTPGLEQTPIVVLTDEDRASVEDRVLELGADDFMLKPFDPVVLMARIRAVFGRQRLAA